MSFEKIEMRYSYLYADLGRPRDPKQVDPRTTGLLQKQFGFTDPKLIGQGSFGTVIRFRHPEGGRDVAIKCVSPKDVREGERKLWIKLTHPNLVPLLSANVCWPLNVVCFEMNAFSKDLMTAVQDKEYLISPQALQQLKTWLYQVLCGLNYLHQKQYCHLDLKSDNVLISRWTSRAVIGDFTCLSQKPLKVKRDAIGLPSMYQPPETSWVLKKGRTVDGRRFDLWSFGVMSFELLTGFHMLRSYSCCYLGTDARYGSMKKALQEESFASKMQEALPAVRINKDDVQMGRSFVHSFLRTDPTCRFTADQGSQHKFLGIGDTDNADVDELWQNPDATIQSIFGLDVSHHQIRVSKQGGGVKKWFRRRCSFLRRLLKCCLPCIK